MSQACTAVCDMCQDVSAHMLASITNQPHKGTAAVVHSDDAANAVAYGMVGLGQDAHKRGCMA